MSAFEVVCKRATFAIMAAVYFSMLYNFTCGSIVFIRAYVLRSFTLAWHKTEGKTYPIKTVCKATKTKQKIVGSPSVSLIVLWLTEQ